jgi:hypothetical protein
LVGGEDEGTGLAGSIKLLKVGVRVTLAQIAQLT